MRSCTLVGIDAVAVDVECSVIAGQLPSFNVVGLPAPSVKEGMVRIRSALKAAGHGLPLKRVTINLAPADLRKPGSALDLPTALAILIADETYPGTELENLLILGELGLDGSLRKVHGVLAAAMLARELGLRGVVVPESCAAEALVAEDVDVYAVRHLTDMIGVLQGDPIEPSRARPLRARRRRFSVDMADVRGQETARLAIEIAVAGGHNLLLSGPPGTGKSMLARRIPTVLPPMTRQEALETTKVYSAVGLADGLIEDRPFRSPHHTISGPALLGGGSPAHAGEISLAHNGVLFLDELPEFTRGTLEALRQPLEDRMITIGRIHGTLTLPASFLLVAAANPCPCGWLHSGVRECLCSNTAVERYRARLSGPLLDRIDLQVCVQPVPLKKLRSEQPGESSAAIRKRVAEARERQRHRLAAYDLHCNAEMPSTVVRACCKLDDECERTLAELVRAHASLSARSIDRMLKVARTIADLLGHDQITPGDLNEAGSYRAIDPVTELAMQSHAAQLAVASRRGAAPAPASVPAPVPPPLPPPSPIQGTPVEGTP